MDEELVPAQLVSCFLGCVTVQPVAQAVDRGYGVQRQCFWYPVALRDAHCVRGCFRQAEAVAQLGYVRRRRSGGAGGFDNCGALVGVKELGPRVVDVFQVVRSGVPVARQGVDDSVHRLGTLRQLEHMADGHAEQGVGS